MINGIVGMGMECHVEKQDRSPSLTTVKAPSGINPKAVVITLQISRGGNEPTGCDILMTILPRTSEKGFPFAYNNTYLRR